MKDVFNIRKDPNCPHWVHNKPPKEEQIVIVDSLTWRGVHPARYRGATTVVFLRDASKPHVAVKNPN